MGNPLFISASLLVLLLQLTNNVEAHQDKHALRQAEGKLKTEVKLKTREHALEHLGNLFKKHKDEKAKKGNKHKKVKTESHPEDEDEDCDLFCDVDEDHYWTEHLGVPANYTIKQTEKRDIESFGKTYLKHSHQFAAQGRAFKDQTCSPESQIGESGYIQYGNGKSTSKCYPFEGNKESEVKRWYKESTDGSCWNLPDGTTEYYIFANIYEDNMCEHWVANDVVGVQKFPAGCFWDNWSSNYKNYRCTEVLTPFNSFKGLYSFNYHNGDNCENHEYPLPNIYEAEVPLGKCEDYITVECSNEERTLTVTEFQPNQQQSGTSMNQMNQLQTFSTMNGGEYMCPMSDKLNTYTFKYSDFDIFNTCQDEDGEQWKIVCIDGSGKIANRHTEYTNA